MSLLRLSLVQTDILWQDPERNRKQLSTKLLPLIGATDVVVLPEMFSTGFSMDTRLAETMTGPTVVWMQEVAQQTGACVVGSFMCADGTKFRNRLVWTHPSGQVEHYDKRHLFTFANEPDAYTAGQNRLIVTHQGWRICPLVCYDLRFPEWSRNVPMDGGAQSAEGQYDLLVYVANWPEVRSKAWQDLLVARAHENLSFVAGVNRVGTDGTGHVYAGHSAVIGPVGEYLGILEAHAEGIIKTEMDLAPLRAYRARFPALTDAAH